MQKPYTKERFERDKKLVNFIDNSGIVLDNPFDNVQLKMIALKDYGYGHLRVAADGTKKPYMPIEKCKPERISSVALDTYERARQRLEQVKGGLLKIVSSSEIKTTKKNNRKLNPTSGAQTNMFQDYNVYPTINYFDIEEAVDAGKTLKGKRKAISDKRSKKPKNQGSEPTAEDWKMLQRKKRPIK